MERWKNYSLLGGTEDIIENCRNLEQKYRISMNYVINVYSIKINLYLQPLTFTCYYFISSFINAQDLVCDVFISPGVSIRKLEF